MKNFFKMVFAVIVGLLCSFFVFLFIMIGLAAGSGDKKSTIVQKNSILELNLDREIADMVVDNPLKNFSVLNPSIPDRIRQHMHHWLCNFRNPLSG